MAIRVLQQQKKTSARKIVLLVVNSEKFFISHRLDWAKYLVKNGFDVHVAIPTIVNQRLLSQEGISCHKITFCRKGKNPIRELSTIYHLIKLYLRLEPDIVHHFTIKPVLYGTFVARLTRRPIILNTITGLGYVFSSEKLTNKILRYFIEKSYRLVFCSSRVRTIFQNNDDKELFLSKRIISAGKCCVIQGSGVDIHQWSFQSEPVGDFVIVYAGRMLWDKGVGDLVEAFKLLRSQYGNIKLLLAGDADSGNPQGITSKQLNAWNNEPGVEWLGHQANIVEIFSMAHIVCLPSYYREGIPKVLIEAAACGKPIVTTNMPGCREIVVHEKNGLLVQPRDVHGLMLALDRLIGDFDLRVKMGQMGRSMVENHFSTEIVFKQTQQVYGDVLGLLGRERCVV